MPVNLPVEALACPVCAAAMSRVALEGHYGTTIDLDVCDGCHGIWFDRRESLRLTPGATLQLFERIHETTSMPMAPAGDRRTCPRCRSPLVDTHDRQRNTPFRYWRCHRGHGRFTTFFDFLREKEFVRPLDAAQIDALRQHTRSVNCSNCGAPIDLATASACGYCQTPLSMLDFAQVERTLDHLRRAEQTRLEKAKGVDPAVVLSLLRERRQVERFFDDAQRRPDWSRLSVTGGLVEAGVNAVVEMLRRLR